MKKIIPLLVLSLGLLVFAVTTFKGVPKESKLDEAVESYEKGEELTTIQERETHFNQALRLYTELEEIYSPTRGNGKLYYNIGNAYFQLGEYPFAILYYNRALLLMPRSKKVLENLEIAQKKLGIDQPPSPFFYLSLPEKMQLLFTLSTLSIFGYSFYIGFPVRELKKVLFFLVMATLLTLLSIGYTHYIAPIEAVLVNGSMLYRDAGKQYAVVREDPVLSGIKVQVLEVLDKGNWLKIKTPADEIGYVPFESVRIVEGE